MKQDKVDEAAKDSFPASDPPANSGIIGPQAEPVDKRDPARRGEDARPKGTPTDERHATETAYQWEDEKKPSQR